MSYFDDKRYVFDDEVHTLAYFHKDSVTSCEEIKKDCIVIRKRRLKKILIKKERLKKIAKNIHVSNKMNSDEFRSSRQFQAF